MSADAPRPGPRWFGARQRGYLPPSYWVPDYPAFCQLSTDIRGFWSLRYDPDSPTPYTAQHRAHDHIHLAASRLDLLREVLGLIVLPSRTRPFVNPATDAQHRAVEAHALAALIGQAA